MRHHYTSVTTFTFMTQSIPCLLYVAIDTIFFQHMALLLISIPTPWPIGHAIVPSNKRPLPTT